MSDGLAVFAVDRWQHDCCARIQSQHLLLRKRVLERSRQNDRLRVMTSTVFIMGDSKKHENKATRKKKQERENFDWSSKQRRGVMDALSTYQQLLTERKRKTQITFDTFLIKRQKIENTEGIA
ncbi:hypothetical protein TNCV_3303761 [Trichonephila clavipes]|nr:hypothetical protein TNCV_3303761 [Trichonephila clavipes]